MNSLKPVTTEWIDKAEGDFTRLERESRARAHLNYDGICFHAQQCAEKYLRARLFEAGIESWRIHDREVLFDRVLEIEPAWRLYRVHLAFLSELAVRACYPGETTDKDKAKDAR